MTLPGEVVDVIDGKTVVVALQTGKVKVELQYIDVPEPSQELYETVKVHLRNLALGKVVNYRPRNIFDDHTVGRLMLNDVDLSQQMLRDGAAWLIPVQVSAQDTSEFELYSATELAAKTDGIGVWSLPNLRPAWELRAERKEKTRREERDALMTPGYGQGPQRTAGQWSDKNPKLGNVGALLSGFNAASQSGFVSTSMIPVSDLAKDHPMDFKMAMDVTYWYKEDGLKGRKGMVVLTLIAEANKYHFAAQNELFVMGDGRTTSLGKAKRSVSGSGENMRETMAYQVTPDALKRLVDSDAAYLKMGNHVIVMMNGRYLLLNILEVVR